MISRPGKVSPSFSCHDVRNVRQATSSAYVITVTTSTYHSRRCDRLYGDANKAAGYISDVMTRKRRNVIGINMIRNNRIQILDTLIH
jgi:hypothetical protein